MTNQHNAAQAANQDQVAALQDLRHGVEMNRAYLDDGDIKLAALDAAIDVLSRLRAPVAHQNERAAFDHWFDTAQGNAGPWSAWQARAALASAPVAGEAQITNTEAADFADKHGMYYDMDQELAGNHARALLAAYAAPQASADAVRDAALEEAAHLMEQTGKRIAASDIRALKQPQAATPSEQGERDA